VLRLLRFLNALNVSQQRICILRLELPFRHVGMADHDAFRKRLSKRLDRILPGKLSKRDRFSVRTVTFGADCVAA